MKRTNVMIRGSRTAAMLAGFAWVVGCVSTGEPESSTVAGPEVVLQVYEELGGPANDPLVSCKVGYRHS